MLFGRLIAIKGKMMKGIKVERIGKFIRHLRIIASSCRICFFALNGRLKGSLKIARMAEPPTKLLSRFFPRSKRLKETSYPTRGFQETGNLLKVIPGKPSIP